MKLPPWPVALAIVLLYYNLVLLEHKPTLKQYVLAWIDFFKQMGTIRGIPT